MIYCGPMPVLIPILAGYFHFRYWTDKFMFTKFCRIPPQYDKQMHMSVMMILPWCLGLHCIFNIYAYADQDIFPLKLIGVYDYNT